ncbi:MAG: hypothetical protein IJD89_03035 [Clostridia bacterium]|nr:hypothetical protein [Clostridia bacterium]
MKVKSILLVLIISLSLILSACGNTFESTDPQSETTTDDSSTTTSTDTKSETTTDDSNTTNTETNTSPSYTKLDNAIQPVITYKTEEKRYYKKVLEYYGQYEYVAKDLPTDFGDYYKVVKTYDDFSELVKSNYLEKSVFDNSYILVIHRNYGGRYITDMGFSNFKIENGEASIDLYEYTGNLMYPDCGFNQTEYYLIPNTIECESTSFKPLTVNKTSVYSYYIDLVEIEDIDLGGRAIIFDEYSNFKDFKNLFDIKGLYSYYGKDSYIIILEAPFFDVASVGPLTLEGSKLTLTIDDSALYDREQNKYLVIEVPAKEYGIGIDYFKGEIPSDCTLEIILNENNQPSYDEIDYAQKNRPETPYDKFLEALLFNHNSDNLTSRIDKVIIKEDGTIGYGSEINKESNKIGSTESTITYLYPNGEISNWSNAYFTNYQDRYNEYSLQIENGVWVKHDGVLKTESIYSHFNVPNLQNHFKELSYDEESGMYYADIIASYTTIYDLRLKIENGYVSYVTFRQGGSWEGVLEELVIITTYDVGTTVVEEPSVGTEAELTTIEPSDEILAELEIIMNERE